MSSRGIMKRNFINSILSLDDDQAKTELWSLPADDRLTALLSSLALPWHLVAANQPGGTVRMDLNIAQAWRDYSGAGVRLGVFDTIADSGHQALNSAFTVPPTGAPVIGASHGTAVAGIIAADPTRGPAVGVAFDATLTSVDMSSSRTADLAAAMQLQRGFDVVNHSWGWAAAFSADPARSSFSTFFAGIREAVANGRDGLGTAVVVANGNSAATGSNGNLSGFTADRQVIAVGGVTQEGHASGFATDGANLWVSAFAEQITTTDLTGLAGYSAADFTDNFSGTSAAAPQVSGVIALMLEANAELGWRDIKNILALSSRPLDGSPARANGAANWNGGGLMHNDDVGFGLVDAFAAVRLAETWEGQRVSANEMSVTSTVTARRLLTETTGAVEYTFTLANTVSLESMQINVRGSHSRVSDIQMELIGPNGFSATILDGHGGTAAFRNWTFTASGVFGMDSGGQWTVRFIDAVAGATGAIEGVTLTGFGAARSDDTVFVYTDSFSALGADAARANIIDAIGHDTINASAVSSDLVINLAAGASSSIAGRLVTIAPGSLIEAVIGGDGEDRIAGNALANRIDGGRGDDTLSGGEGNDTLHGGRGENTVDGGAGFDVAKIDGAFGAAQILFDGASGLAVRHALGHDALRNIEMIRFDDFTLRTYRAEAADLMGDFNGDGRDDILWINADGFVASWRSGPQVVNAALGQVASDWTAIAAADMDGDARDDVLWRDGAGQLHLWRISDGQPVAAITLGDTGSSQVALAADLTGDGRADLLLRDGAAGHLTVRTGERSIDLGATDASWRILGAADVDGNGASDILWRHDAGGVGLWFMGQNGVERSTWVGGVDNSWQVQGFGDFGGAGHADLLWRHAEGGVGLWHLDGAGTVASGTYLGQVDRAWQIQGAGDVNADGVSDIAWRHDNGNTAVWLMGQNGPSGNIGFGMVDNAWTWL